ncbi:MAG TPA: FAD-dependent oxidoreductase [Terriglobia bacterium]|nr:FAD-dependent oxidoreductase [Terriglobia bacterium]
MSTVQVTWPAFKIKLLNRSEAAQGTMAFQFERSAGWTFKAGQFVDITALDPLETDSEGNVRGFSIASAPYEDTLMVATRMRNTAFKRELAALPLQTEFKIEGPFGNLVLHKNAKKPAILLAGGIGITPFRSIARQAAHERLPHQIYLFYSNYRPEDAPFLEEFCELEKQNPNYHFIPTMTAMERSDLPWSGERGFINAPLLAKHLKVTAPSGPPVAEAIYYLAGPPGMVAALRKMLVDWGVDEDNIRGEEFAGY